MCAEKAVEVPPNHGLLCSQRERYTCILAGGNLDEVEHPRELRSQGRIHPLTVAVAFQRVEQHDVNGCARRQTAYSKTNIPPNGNERELLCKKKTHNQEAADALVTNKKILMKGCCQQISWRRREDG